MSDALAMFVLGALALWTAFWVIRLGVRYGVGDALRTHCDLVRRERGAERSGDRVDEAR